MKQKIAFYFILLLYTIIGLYYSNSQGFWLDEIHTLTFLKGISAYGFKGSTLYNIRHVLSVNSYKVFFFNDNFLKNFHIQILHEGHPPLYFLFLKGWSLIVGLSEISLRGFSLICGILSITILFSTTKERFKNNQFVCWVIFLLILFNPFLFYYFTEARMYALAFLFASLSFSFYIKFKKNESLKFSYFVLFCLSSTALLYTHYYGLFFFLTIVFYELIKGGFSLKTIKYFIPLVLFLPWVFIIKVQAKIHAHHWTDGTFSFLKSTLAFKSKLMELFLFSTENNGWATSLFSITAGLLIILYISKSNKKRLLFFSLLFFYFLEIFLFDRLKGHHTINVPRYYIFILIFFYWAIAQSIENSPKSIVIVFGFVYLFFSGTVFYRIIDLSLGKKQMNKEVALYLDSNVNPKNTILVVEPGGVIIWGLAYYLKNDYFITSIDNFNRLTKNELKSYNKVVFIEDMICYSFRMNHFNINEKSKLKKIEFVGFNLYK